MLIKINPDFQKKLNRKKVLFPQYLEEITKYLLTQKFLRISLFVALSTWMCWLIVLEPSFALKNTIANWEIALTMVFGSMVAGGTSLGGGAVAFPVLTKVLEIPPHEAKVFALAIQTIGMGAASITIIAMKTKLEWRLISLITLGGLPGIIISTLYLSFFIPASIIKISFSMIISSFAIFLWFLNHRNYSPKRINYNFKQSLILILTGFVGGIISGLVGSGMDIVSFAVMILIFNLCEKNSTATSVILMALNSAIGFLLHKFIMGDFIAPVSNYWLAAVPVVVIGAPLGTIICSHLNKNTIIRVLLVLILIDLISSLLLIPLTIPVITTGIIVFLTFTILYYLMRCYPVN